MTSNAELEKEIRKLIKEADAKSAKLSDVADPRRTSKATARGHIHIPGPRRFLGGVPKTHAWYRRRRQIPPTRMENK